MCGVDGDDVHDNRLHPSAARLVDSDVSSKDGEHEGAVDLRVAPEMVLAGNEGLGSQFYQWRRDHLLCRLIRTPVEVAVGCCSGVEDASFKGDLSSSGTVLAFSTGGYSFQGDDAAAKRKKMID
ncbi:hypothetical protein Ancab_013076 [Ancistrocladus abbreviatus]